MKRELVCFMCVIYIDESKLFTLFMVPYCIPQKDNILASMWYGGRNPGHSVAYVKFSSHSRNQIVEIYIEG